MMSQGFLPFRSHWVSPGNFKQLFQKAFDTKHMDYLYSIRQMIPVLRAEMLDGSKELTETKKLAVGYVLEQYGPVSPDEVRRNDRLRNAMETSLADYYGALEGKKAKPQVVYVDLSEFHEFYDAKFGPVLGKAFSSWQRDFLKELRDFYRLPDGSNLNIIFTTDKPKEGSFMTVAVTPQNFDDYMYASRERMAKLPSSQRRGDKEVDVIIKRVTASLPIRVREEEKMVEVANDPEFRRRVGRGGNGRTILAVELEFGNPTPDDIVWIGAARLYGSFEISRETLEGRSISVGSYIPWIGEDQGRNVARAFAEVTAHEVGHALGLQHPLNTLRDFQGGRPIPIPNRQGHLMDPIILRDRLRPGVARFNIFSTDYLKFVLGVEK